MSINRKLKQNLKKMEKKQAKEQNRQDVKYFNQAYRPETEVKLTGEEFMYLRKFLQDVRNERVIRVIDANRNQIGQGLSPRDMDIENVFGYVEQLHRKNVDAGITVSIDVLRKELEEEQKKEDEVVREPQPQGKLETSEDNVVIKEVGRDTHEEGKPGNIGTDAGKSPSSGSNSTFIGVSAGVKVEEKESFRADSNS